MWQAVALAGLAFTQQALVFEPNLFVREEGTGQVRWDDALRTPDESRTLRVEHTGSLDWAVALGSPIPVTQGDVLRLSAPIKLDGSGIARLSYVVRSGEQVLDWTAGGSQLTRAEGWQQAKASWVATGSVTSLQPRLEGSGPVMLNLGAALLERERLPLLGGEAARPRMLQNADLELSLDPVTFAAELVDRRTGKVWRQRPVEGALLVSAVRESPGALELTAKGSDGSSEYRIGVRLEPGKPELVWTLDGPPEQPLPADLAFPGALVAGAGTRHVLPMNMGIGFDASDPAIDPMWLVGYGGHGLCMAFYGQLEEGSGVLSIFDRSDDFLLTVDRKGSLLEAAPRWRGEKGRFGYKRTLRQCFLARADETALAQRYRQHVIDQGLHVTLAKKALVNPDVARVARAANLWTWGDDKLELARQAHALGMRNVLWSGGGTPEELQAIGELGFVRSRYDIYQDVMDPARFGDLPWTHPDWTTGAWPDQLVRSADGDWVKGWVVQDRQGRDVPCAVCCDLEALAFAEDRIAQELKTHPFEARFIDTTTASEYRECWDPRHPMTRSQSREARMALLQRVSDFGLVTGSETGHEASVPHLVFFEGMMSLGPYRVDDAGTDPPKLYDTLPDRVLKYQLGPQYRLPLWQLVYGDCTVSTWYWGDFNNKHAGTWDIRDQWNMLYGTPPMYFTDLEGLRASAQRFARSYRETQRVLEHAAMQRMLAFRYLTPDRTVQQTDWANGLRVTANFGSTPYAAKGMTLPPGGVEVRSPQ